MRVCSLLLVIVSRAAGGGKVFDGVPSACTESGTDDTTTCLFDCDTGGTCASGSNVDCCTYYTGARVTAVEDIIALANFAEECNHPDWAGIEGSHQLDWCNGVYHPGSVPANVRACESFNGPLCLFAERTP